MDASQSTPNLVFLKLGGSLITDKTRVETARPPVIRRLAAEIRRARERTPGLQLVVGHGSGSFGHAAARAKGYDNGHPRTGEGFVVVARAAARLNRLVADALADANVPTVVFPPSASGRARDGLLQSLAVAPFRSALAAGVIPLTYGDVVWDDAQGWSIASTEAVLSFLAGELRPQRIILAGSVPGVMRHNTAEASDQPIAEITPDDWPSIRTAIYGAEGIDVTGGMAGKVTAMLRLVQAIPGLQVMIISGSEPGRVEEALSGRGPVLGTWIRTADDRERTMDDGRRTM
jgi:isopentenyl phosphate kinase